MEVRVGLELIGGVIHVRGQELTHKVAVDVTLGRHVVGEAKQVHHAHVPADSHFVNKEWSDFCDVQVLEKVTNKAGERKVVAPVTVFGRQNLRVRKKGASRKHKQKAELVCSRSL